jgi:LuxR family transcriptional regulator, maltose regulon positive regulatory protein
MNALLPTKFYVPPLPAGFIGRPQLFEKLDQSLVHRLTLVSAPAGSGKTTLVSAWVKSLRKKGLTFGWLSLDDADNTLERFLKYLVVGLEEGGFVTDAAILPTHQMQQAQVEDILGNVIRGMVDRKRELILILDDYHNIKNKEVHAALEYLLAHAPPCLHLILLTRSDPPLELAYQRVAGQLVELRMDQLRFTTQEAGAYLKKNARVLLTESDVTALNARAEGWIAGLQMAAISLSGRDDASAFVAAFAGSHRFVFDYLLEQVLNRQTPEVREFLLQTSVLEKLSAPLCDAVAETERTASSLLKSIEQDNLFLVSLDDQRTWYRYHHLFSDLLRLVLEQTHPRLSTELHHRACRWYEAQGLLPEALHHALAAGDMAHAASLVSTNVLTLVEQSELAPVLMRMDALPQSQRDSLPWLQVAYAWALAYKGQIERVEAALWLAGKSRGNLSEDERSRMMGHVAAVRAYAAWLQGSQQDAVKFAEEAARCLPLDEIAVRALNLTTLGNALTQYKANPRAAEVLKQGIALARQAGQSHVFLPAATALAYAFMMLGEFHKSYEICLEAIEIAEKQQNHHMLPLPAAASAYAELANIFAEWGETERSIQAARKGLALSELWGQADTMMLCLLSLANALSLAHEGGSAQEVLQRARKIANKVSPWFVLNVDQMELRIWLDTEEYDKTPHTPQSASGTLPVSLEARLLVKENRLDEALALLEHAIPDVNKTPSVEVVRLGVIQALAFFLKRNEPLALSVLKQTLELAEPENRIATFVREGPAMEKLLKLAQTKCNMPQFILRLLAVFEAKRKPRPAPAIEPLIETLSKRELEVLKYLNGPHSTPEIAEQLVVSSNTVRTHIKNIYGKLGVHGRSGAVRRAKELGLLE